MTLLSRCLRGGAGVPSSLRESAGGETRALVLLLEAGAGQQVPAGQPAVHGAVPVEGRLTGFLGLPFSQIGPLPHPVPGRLPRPLMGRRGKVASRLASTALGARQGAASPGRAVLSLGPRAPEVAT